MRQPTSTYRVQVHAGFDLAAVTGILDYVADLGAGWVYLSPLLTAEPGSPHGYDVIDHGAVDPARGGRAELERAAQAAHERGLGVLVDIVPNHVGVATPHLSVWWWDVLTNGPASVHAHAFDIDWEAGGGKLRLPILGDEDEPDLRIDDGELRYYDHRFPLAPGSADDGAPAAEVHRRQHYELMSWRRADQDLNYRRFFAINTLAGIRVELPDVFDGQPSRDRLVDRRGPGRRAARRPSRRPGRPRGLPATSRRRHRRRAGVGREDPRGRRAAPRALARGRHDGVRRAGDHRSSLRRSGGGGGARRRWLGRSHPRHEAGRRRRDAQQRGPPPGA